MNTSLSNLFGENMLDAFNGFDRNFFRDFSNMDRMLYGHHAQDLMKTDVTQTAEGYQLSVDLPGFKKDDIQVELNDGYLTIATTKSMEENNENGKVLRRERYTGQMQRTFYVGNQLTEDDIHAAYENGVLRLSIPRKDAQAAPKKHTICIEG